MTEDQRQPWTERLNQAGFQLDQVCRFTHVGNRLDTVTVYQRDTEGRIMVEDGEVLEKTVKVKKGKEGR